MNRARATAQGVEGRAGAGLQPIEEGTWLCSFVPAVASESLMREWGRYLEDELVGVEIVIMNTPTSGSIHLPTSSVRGRDAQPDLFATLEQAEAVVDSAWSPASGVNRLRLKSNIRE